MPATSLDGFHQTKTAQAFDELARAFVDAINTHNGALFDQVLARNFVSYSFDGTRSRTGTKNTMQHFGTRLQTCTSTFMKTSASWSRTTSLHYAPSSPEHTPATTTEGPPPA